MDTGRLRQYFSVTQATSKTAAAAFKCLLIVFSNTALAQLVLSPTVESTDAAEVEQKKKTGGLLPGVRSSFSYSTNSSLVDVNTANKSGDFILEVTPYVTAESEAVRFKYRLDYSIANLYRIRSGDSILGRQRLSAKLTSALGGDWLWLDANGLIANTYTDLFGPLSSDPNIAFVNSSQIRTFSLSPYIRSRLGGYVDATARYGLQYTSTGRSLPEQSKYNNTFSADLRGVQADGQNWNWSWGGEYQLRKFGSVNIGRKYSSGSVFWVPTPSVRLSATAAYDQIDGLVARNGDKQGVGGGFGINWNPLDRTSISVQALKRYYGTSGQASITHSSNWVTFSGNYSKGVTGSLDSSIFSIDPGSVFGSGPATNDPVYLRLIAQNLRLGYGIPYAAGVIEDTYIQQQQAGASLGLIGVRNSLSFSVYASQRDSSFFVQAVPVGGSGPRGGGVGISSTYKGLIRIFSASADYRYKFDARTDFNTSFTAIKTEAPTTTLSSRSSTISVGVSTLLTPDTKAGAGVRRTVGKTSALVDSKFEDTAIYGSLDLRF